MWKEDEFGVETPTLEWLDSAIDGGEKCPGCGDDTLNDYHDATTQESWLGCDCGFQYTYEKA